MSRTTGVVVAVFGFISAVAGVIVGLVPVGSCGAFFAPAGAASISFADTFDDVVCSNDFVGRGWLVWCLIIAGVLALIIGLVRAIRPVEEVEEPVRLDLSATRRRQAEAATQPGSIGELAALHERGALTDEEFAAAKRKVVGL